MLVIPIMNLGDKIMSRSAMVFAFVAGIAFGASTGAQAQQEQQKAASGANAIDSGTASKKMDDAGNKGSPGNASGTLMDKRSKAMSPSGASSPGKSGEIQQ
jgi:hypothetical protein